MLCHKKTKKGETEWSHGHLPCHGIATYKEGFPDVFSVAMEAGMAGFSSKNGWFL